MTILRASETLGETTGERLRVRTDRGELQRLYRGAFIDPASTEFTALKPEAQHALRVAAIAPSLSAGVISGISAAALHGLPVPATALKGKVQVSRASGGKGSRWIRVRRAELDESEITVAYGIPVTTVERTLRDLCHDPLVSIDQLLAVADAALHLGVRLDAAEPGARDRRRHDFIAEHASLFAESPFESMSRAIMIRHGLPPAIEQLEVLDSSGRFLGRADFGWPDFGTLGEYDGRSKYDELVLPGQTASDVVVGEKAREQGISDEGWRFVRWASESVREPSRLVRSVRNTLDTGSQSPRPRGHWRQAQPQMREMSDWSELLGVPR